MNVSLSRPQLTNICIEKKRIPRLCRKRLTVDTTEIGLDTLQSRRCRVVQFESNFEDGSLAGATSCSIRYMQKGPNSSDIVISWSLVSTCKSLL